MSIVVPVLGALRSATVIDGDTIIGAGRVVRLHSIDARQLDQTLSWQGGRSCAGTMSLAALKALTVGVNVRCEVVKRDRHGRQGLLAQ